VRQLAHVLDEDQVRAADVDLVAGGELPIAVEALVVDARAVEAAHVADVPVAVSVEQLGVLAAAQVVLEDDATGWRPAQGVALPGGQGKDIPETVIAANHQVSPTGSCHARA
jgi:hypothetical protein